MKLKTNFRAQILDLIKNKHKKTVKDQIKELSNDKKIYELTEKRI